MSYENESSLPLDQTQQQGPQSQKPKEHKHSSHSHIMALLPVDYRKNKRILGINKPYFNLFGRVRDVMLNYLLRKLCNWSKV